MDFAESIAEDFFNFYKITFTTEQKLYYPDCKGIRNIILLSYS